ncbi:hypothetical protein HYW73_01175 [Candidatus Nomurabacteria bacterium]|nr:hypothetical protein [Candidatus Nomurabacteria bacterium]
MDTMAVLITPDSVRDKIDHLVLADLTTALKATVIFQKYLSVTKTDVESVYQRLVKRCFFSALVHNTSSGLSLFVVFQGQELFPQIKAVKGMFRLKNGRIICSGLRLKYQGKSLDQLTEEGYRGKQLFYRLFEFRLHTTDNAEETIKLCRLVLSPAEFSSVLKNTEQYQFS